MLHIYTLSSPTTSTFHLLNSNLNYSRAHWLVESERLQAICLFQGAPSFFNIDFPWLSHDQKMKIHDLSTQHIFPSKRYTTYECIPELAVTFPSARSTIVKKIKRFIIWPYKWSRVTFTELLSAVVKIPWHYHHFLRSFAILHDFPGLENGLPKFHDFPWPGGTLLFWCLTNSFKAVNVPLLEKGQDLRVNTARNIPRYMR